MSAAQYGFSYETPLKVGVSARPSGTVCCQNVANRAATGTAQVRSAYVMGQAMTYLRLVVPAPGYVTSFR